MKSHKHNYKAYILSGLAALVMTVVFYAASNSSVPISKEISYLKILGRTKPILFPEKVHDEFLFVNISYDRDLVEVEDKNHFPKGNIDITNRKHLIEFLEIANRRQDYKYIFLDVRFDDELKTDSDSALVELIVSTPRLVIPRHEEMNFLDERLKSKAGWADYHGTISEGDFVKYVVGDSEKPSMVLKAYEEMSGKTSSAWWRFAVSDGKLMRTSFVPLLEFNVTGPLDQDNMRTYYNLGADLLRFDSEYLENILSDKYVFVGDFEDVDIHQSYLGPMPGSIIHANVLLNLIGEKHLVGYGTLLLFFLLFWLLNIMMVSEIPGLNNLKQPGWMKRRAEHSQRWHVALTWWEWIYSFLGYGFIFSVVFLAMLIFNGQVYEVLVLSVVFLMLSRSVNYIKKHTTK